jgi:hypothetical protein
MSDGRTRLERWIADEAVDDFDIRGPMRGVDPFDAREHFHRGGAEIAGA